MSVFFLSLSLLLLLLEEGGIESADSGAQEAIEVDEEEDEVDKERVGNEQVEGRRLVVCILGQWFGDMDQEQEEEDEEGVV